MFYKIGFYILLVLVILFVWFICRTNPTKNKGALSWTEFYSDNPTATIKFMNDNFDINVMHAAQGVIGDGDYNVIRARGAFWPFGGITENPKLPNGMRVPTGTIVYLTVPDYDAAHTRAIKTGAVPIATNLMKKDMKFGFYKMPGNVFIGMVQFKVRPTKK